jgi:2,4-dichlorophenol 6-monooxygenase
MPDFDDGQNETEVPSRTVLETDVLIVGSGPAGGAAALALALATLGVPYITFKADISAHVETRPSVL